MKKPAHIIKTLITEIQMPSPRAQQKAFEYQNRMSAIAQGKLRAIFDQVFSDFSKPDEIHRIDRLELEIGNIPSHFPESLFLAQVEKVLRQTLAEKLSHASTEVSPGSIYQGDFPANGQQHWDQGPDGQKKPKQSSHPSTKVAEKFSHPQKTSALSKGSEMKPKTALELLNFFFKTGTLPWWVDRNQTDVVAKALEHLFIIEPDRLKPLLQETLSNTIGLKRIIYQFSDPQLGKMIELLCPAHSAPQLMVFAENIRTILPNEMRVTIWQTIFLGMIGLLKELTPPTRIVEELLLHLAGLSRLPKKRFFETILSKIPELSQPEFNDSEFNLASVTEKLLKIESQRENQQTQVKAESQPENLPTQIQAEKPLENQPTQITTSQRLQKTQLENQQLPLIPQTGEDPFSDTETLYINNAGLVLFTQFLPQFFTKINLVQENTFISEAAAKRAVLILQYLVTGAVESPEYQLPLNKILCAVNLLEPIEISLAISRDEEAECHTLLNQLVKLSPRIQGSFIDEFRDIFLNREGLLGIRDRTWLLRVEYEGRDILLEPSFLSTRFISLPWMRDPLFLEWN